MGNRSNREMDNRLRTLLFEFERLRILTDSPNICVTSDEILDLIGLVNNIEDPSTKYGYKFRLAAVLIDLGESRKDETVINNGIFMAEELLVSQFYEASKASLLYNLANGYGYLADGNVWNESEVVSKLTNRNKAKCYYVKCIKELEKVKRSTKEDNLLAQVYVNYANLLDQFGRTIEALDLYEKALGLDSSIGEALGNKAICLSIMALVSPGLERHYLVESKNLLDQCLQKAIPRTTRKQFLMHLTKVNSSIAQQYNSDFIKAWISGAKQDERIHPTSLISFCKENKLFLTPDLYLDKNLQFLQSDPLFLSQSAVVKVFESNDEYDTISFMNHIKQEYVFCRLLLFQSQHRCACFDRGTKGVFLCEPFQADYYGNYIESLKKSLTGSIDALDKISHFVYQRYDLRTPPIDKIYFKNVFLTKDQNFKKFLFLKKNPFLLALADLSIDCEKTGYYGELYSLRNALTHRVVRITDVYKPTYNFDHISVIGLFDLTMKSVQLLRSAIFYLTLSMDYEITGKKFNNLPLTAADIHSLSSLHHIWLPKKDRSKR